MVIIFNFCILGGRRDMKMKINRKYFGNVGETKTMKRKNIFKKLNILLIVALMILTTAIS
jgi:hypothetical protein